MAVIPTAKALYLCEEVDNESGAINLYALFDAIRPRVYPHTEPFDCFAQLRGGLGDIPCRVEVRRADDSRLVYVTDILHVHFPNRGLMRQVAITIEGCIFDSPGVHLVEWYCDNAWVADTALLLRDTQP